MVDKKLKAYEVANDTRKFEIDLFWRRSLFFWGFIASSFAFLGLFYSNKGLSLAISSFGLIGSLCWTLGNRGSEYWYENWEKHVVEKEDEITGPLFRIKDSDPKDKGIWGAKRFSVSRLTTALSDYVTILWLLIFINILFSILNWYSTFTLPFKATVLTLLTIIWIIAIFVDTSNTEYDEK